MTCLLKPPNFQKRNREVKVKRSCYGVGVALLCFAGFGGPQRQVLQLSHAFFIVYNLTAGRVKQINFKMNYKVIADSIKNRKLIRNNLKCKILALTMGASVLSVEKLFRKCRVMCQRMAW